jgi:hypothetical protein
MPNRGSSEINRLAMAQAGFAPLMSVYRAMCTYIVHFQRYFSLSLSGRSQARMMLVRPVCPEMDLV